MIQKEWPQKSQNAQKGEDLSALFHLDAALRTLGTEYSATVTKSTFGITVAVTNSSTRWDIKLDPQKGKGTYRVTQTSERTER